MSIIQSLSRRDILKGAAGISSILLAASLGGCESILDKIRNRPVRRLINTLSPGDPVVESYKDAVAAMQALPAADGRSWLSQANIHNNWCPHGNWYFLPWHRAFLFYFEKICRAQSGNPDFALPYWNWQLERRVPPAFWESGSPLNHSPRSANSSSMVSTAFVGQSVIQNILSIDESNFFLFASGQSATQRGVVSYGLLEATPHNNVHVFVGGDMGSVPTAARDPVFWCHHAMVDCIWADWNIKRSQRNTNDPAWSDFTFAANFYDDDGSSVDAQVLFTVLMPLLSYRYETSQKGDAAARLMSAEDQAALQRVLEEGARVRTTVQPTFELRRGLSLHVDRPATGTIKVDAAALRAAVGTTPARTILVVRGVEQPPAGDVFVRVFVNKPEAGPQTPVGDPHYAGSFAFFTGPQMAAMGPADYLVDATETVRRLTSMGRIGDRGEVDINLVAVPQPGRAVRIPPIRLQGISLAISPIGGVDQ